MTQLSLLPSSNENITPLPSGLITVVVPPLDGEFLYAFDPLIHPSLGAGSIVEVQLGKRRVSGFVVSINSARETQALEHMKKRSISIKPIPTQPTPVQAFTSEHLEFLEWIARYYSEPLSKVLDVAIPTPAFERPDPVIKRTNQEETGRLGTAQKRILALLAESGAWIPLSRVRLECSATSAMVVGLERKGLIERRDSNPDATSLPYSTALTSTWDQLSTEQQQATSPIVQHVKQRSFASFLLHGVTGSGKTEVYLELIIQALSQGQTALVIVPEIALTPQLLDRFESRLKQSVSVLHSSLRPHQRWQHWANVLSGKTRVVIGARSAIFAPMKNLGVIIVDEEHDTSFKQGEGLRYHARDLAIVRAKLAHCPIVLGSATPSLESYHHARSGRHALLTLKNRYFTSKPLQFDVVDLNRLKPWEMPSKSVSPKLLSRLKETLQNGEQAFILYNRRGFATYLQCERCEHVVGCPHCSVTLTFHRATNSLLCHFCGFSTPPPSACSHCGARDPSASGDITAEPLFKHRGSGTERVFEEISELLPNARIAKLDRDTARSIDDYTAILSKMRGKEIDILVGTQMIAKGHDLPDVTFVGIVDCDVGLHIPDFRAAERAFQLLTQVAGRAGRRDKQGFVVLQTRVPQHLSLQTTIKADYLAFANRELEMRETLGYPPYQRLLRVIVGAEDNQTARDVAASLALEATPACQSLGITILGPAPAPVEKVRNLWRHHILFKDASAAKLQSLMHRLKGLEYREKNIRIVFDLDPQEML